jgi:hypothetical protein
VAVCVKTRRPATPIGLPHCTRFLDTPTRRDALGAIVARAVHIATTGRSQACGRSPRLLTHLRLNGRDSTALERERGRPAGPDSADSRHSGGMPTQPSGRGPGVTTSPHPNRPKDPHSSRDALPHRLWEWKDAGGPVAAEEGTGTARPRRF